MVNSGCCKNTLLFGPPVIDNITRRKAGINCIKPACSYNNPGRKPINTHGNWDFLKTPVESDNATWAKVKLITKYSSSTKSKLCTKLSICIEWG